VFIEEINLIAFRNYLEAHIKLEKQKLIVIGQNAQGKSNLIEVIELFSHFKSRRAKKDQELINFDFEEAILKIKIQDNHAAEDLAVQIRKSGRRTYKLNGVNKKPKELLGKVLSVSFMAEDLNIINASPSYRRDFLNSILKQFSATYNENLANFEKILSQRNGFLKALQEKAKFHLNSLNPSEKDQLNTWNELYLQEANKLTNSRKIFIAELEPKLDTYYKNISGNTNNQIKIEYQHQILTLEDLESSFSKDIARGYSNLGPHRDDFEILLNTKTSSSFASQGEKRSIILALKLSELEMLKERFQDYPLLILDDVLAELDEDRQDFLLDAVNNQAQVLITTTHIGKHLEKWSQDSQIIEVENGTIKELSKI